MFVGKAGAYPSGTPSGTSLQGRLLILYVLYHTSFGLYQDSYCRNFVVFEEIQGPVLQKNLQP